MVRKITRGVIFDDRGKGKYQSLYRGKKLLRTIKVSESDFEWRNYLLQRKNR